MSHYYYIYYTENSIQKNEIFKQTAITDSAKMIVKFKVQIINILVNVFITYSGKVLN